MLAFIIIICYKNQQQKQLDKIIKCLEHKRLKN